MNLRTPKQAAEHLIDKFGIKQALDYAGLWASIGGPELPRSTAYWQEVVAEVKFIQRKGRVD